MAATDYWLMLFNHPDFRAGWREYELGYPPQEHGSDQYYYGRQTAAESGKPLPKPSLVFSHEMLEVLDVCTALMEAITFRRFLNALNAYCNGNGIKLANPGEVLEVMRAQCVVGQRQIADIIAGIGELENRP